MGRKHARTVAAAAGARALAGGLAAGCRPGRREPPAAQVAFRSADLAERAAVALSGESRRLVEALRLGAAAALGSADCARLALASRPFLATAEASVAERVCSALEGGCLLQDAPAPRERPLLALSHLESMAHAPLLFGAARELLDLCSGCAGCREGSAEAPGDADEARGGAVLLEVSGDEDGLCDAVVGLCFPEAAASEERRSSAVARVAELLFRFRPPEERWSALLLDAMLLRLPGEEVAAGAEAGPPKPSPGGSLETLLLGVGQLRPVTRVARRASTSLGAAAAAALCCQVLERLLSPMSASALTLHLRFPAAGALAAQKRQPPEFLEALGALGEEALGASHRALELWALEAEGRRYLVLLE